MQFPENPVVITHANTFHPDEVLAIALLEKFFFKMPVMVKRTRDEKELEKSLANPTQFVVDVGFEFNPAYRNFDHHQKEMSHTWSDGTPFSACGLIWQYLRNRKLLAHFNDELLNNIEEELIRPADKLDNGLLNWEPGNIISNFNREGAHQLEQFYKAKAFAADLIENTFFTLEKDLQVKQTIRHALRTQFDIVNGILLLPAMVSDASAIIASKESNGSVEVIVSPRVSEKQWLIITAPLDHSDPFSQKNPAPEEWRGRSNFKVDIDGQAIHFIFCHKAGFMSILEGTEEQAMLVARTVINHQFQVKNKSNMTM